MSYVFPFDHPHNLTSPELNALLGGKAANIAVMVTELGLPVPPGFTISTEACRAYLRSGWPEGLSDEIREHLDRLEEDTGRRFGDAADPLLVSVRSGAPVSMPGMMDTILNLGLNDATTEGLARVTEDESFAQDCRGRFEATYRHLVGAPVPGEPWDQLRAAIEAVFRSWNSERARRYRTREGIPDDLGTGATVQAMVFGNRDERSGTGVLFTRNPATGDPGLYGEVIFRAQGEDLVSGTQRGEPLEMLQGRLPAVAEELRRHAHTLERYLADVGDIEFTIEQGRLWILQVRVGKRSPQAALRVAVDMAEEDGFPLSREEAVRRVADLLADPPVMTGVRTGDGILIATGLPASPGLASGEVVTTPEAAVAEADLGRQVILVRSDTSPDDVHGMARAAGILTSTGGITCHAAVVARGWGIPAVVGADAVRIEDGNVSIGDRTLRPGDVLTIDGSSGEVFAGEMACTTTIVPEAETLLAWAEELGIGIEEEEVAVPDGVGTESPGPTMPSVLRALLIKGFATPDQIATALVTSPEQARTMLESLAGEGSAELAGGMYRLTAEGRTKGDEVIADDRASWGAERAEDALEAFLPLDLRMKEVVTAWPMREVDGEQVINDHSDPHYDASVLADLASLHVEAVAWLQGLTSGLPRLDAYVARLERAAERTADGQHAYIASPAVDSSHSIWFELHEDLILLAGRSREDEVAAGRA